MGFYEGSRGGGETAPQAWTSLPMRTAFFFASLVPEQLAGGGTVDFQEASLPVFGMLRREWLQCWRPGSIRAKPALPPKSIGCP